MSVSVPVHTLFNTHTFGRHHHEPAPLPQNVQQGQMLHVAQMGGNAWSSEQAQGMGLPEDFDHLVRSIGEW